MSKPAITILASALLAMGPISLSGCASHGLSKAAYGGNLARARQLLQKGADANAYDRWGWTPLHWAVYYKNDHIARVLLEHGADPNLATKSAYGTVPTGSTPLIIAAYYGYAGMARLLLERGADTGRTNDFGYTALYYAELYGHEETTGVLKTGTPDKEIIPDSKIIPQ